MANNLFDLKLAGDDALIKGGLIDAEIRLGMDLFDAVRLELAVSPLPADRKKLVTKAVPGAAVTATLGKNTFTGDIVRVEYRVERDRPERLVLHGLEKLHRLRPAGVSEVNKQAKDKILAALVKPSGATVKATAVEETARELILLDPCALGLVKRYCLERNFSIYWDGKAVQFAPRGKGGGAAVKVAWTEVKSIRLDTDLSELVTGVKVLGYDHVKDQAVQYEAAAAVATSFSGGDTGVALRKKAFGESKVVRDERWSVPDNKAAQELAKGELLRRADRFLKGQVSLHGIATPLPGGKLTLTDAPWPYGGPFVIESVCHRMVTGTSYETVVGFFSNSTASAA